VPGIGPVKHQAHADDAQQALQAGPQRAGCTYPPATQPGCRKLAERSELNKVDHDDGDDAYSHQEHHRGLGCGVRTLVAVGQVV